MVRYLKEKNDKVINLVRDTKKNKELLEMKIKFMGYSLSFSLVLISLLVFALVATHVLK